METFIQPKIMGYRQLTEEEATLMNEGKALAEQVGAYVEKLKLHQAGVTAAHGSPDAEPLRWIAIGKTQVQQGFMALMRAIAKPTTF